VQIDYDGLGRQSGKCSHRDAVLFRPNTQVDVAVGTYPAFGVQSSDRPALDQQRLHTRRPKQRDGLDDLAFLAASLESVQTVHLPKFVGSGRRA